MRVRGLGAFVVALVAAVALISSAGAGTAASPVTKKIDLSTSGAVAQYLRSIHVDPTRAVIQRGTKNYAGSSCPGAGWTCTAASSPVVQIASPGGKNVFQCSSGRCAVVQVSTAALAANKATCIKTTGISQSCSITQSGTTAENQAIVVETAPKSTGLTQSASQTAQIVQQATSGMNTACVSQTLTLTASTVGSKGSPVTESLDAHQSISVKQDSATGANVVKNATSNACDSDGSAMTQSQAISQTATSAAGITQNENATASGPNALIDIEQNQSTPTATGTNTSAFTQTSNLTALAVTPAGVVQTQSSAGGGLKATVNQFSTGVSTSAATQNEMETADADKPGGAELTSGVTQTQFGPVRCCSTQASNAADIFTVTQTSSQTNDTGTNQKNTVAADCTSSGNCTATQTTTVNDSTTTNTQTGSSVSTSIDCTNSACTKPTITFDGTPGTGSPPATLGPYAMTSFGADVRTLGESVSNVPDTAGTIGFTPALQHLRIGQGWATWSNGYTGDVYATTGTQATITLPAGTKAFYFYAEPQFFSTFSITATAQDGTTSTPITVDGNGGAQYFGFYGTGGATLSSITVSTTDTTGFAVGEFGIKT